MVFKGEKTSNELPKDPALEIFFSSDSGSTWGSTGYLIYHSSAMQTVWPDLSAPTVKA
jgi:hypothetical protein